MRTTAAILVLFCCYAASAGAAEAAHDFDSQLGNWHTTLKRLAHPLSGSNDWLDYSGTTTVRAVMDGRANLAELRVAGVAGRIDGVSLRLYDPTQGQWSLNYANLADGSLGIPSIGKFVAWRGEFYSNEKFHGRDVRVRFVIRPEGADVIHFEQAFSIDAGRTWEVNWIATDTRIR
jgi:hypothetical protein